MTCGQPAVPVADYGPFLPLDSALLGEKKGAGVVEHICST